MLTTIYLALVAEIPYISRIQDPFFQIGIVLLCMLRLCMINTEYSLSLKRYLHLESLRCYFSPLSKKAIGVLLESGCSLGRFC